MSPEAQYRVTIHTGDGDPLKIEADDISFVNDASYGGLDRFKMQDGGVLINVSNILAVEVE